MGLALAASIVWTTAEPSLPASSFALGASVVGGVLLLSLLYARAHSWSRIRDGLRRTGFALLASASILLGVRLALGAGGPVTDASAAVGFLFVPFAFAGRIGCQAALATRVAAHRVLVLGTGELACELASLLRVSNLPGVELMGFLSNDPDAQGAEIAGAPVLGWNHDAEKVLADRRVDHIVVASDDGAIPSETLLAAKLSGVWVETGERFYERLTGRVYLPALHADSLVLAPECRAGRGFLALKRAFDVSASVLGSLLSSPLLLIAAIAIRLDSGGPILYAQQRVGAQGRLFWIWKLRTMDHQAEYESGPVWACSEDARVTRVGRVLRRSRVDELPQLWNVLRGEMSLIGPRPERPEFIAELSEELPHLHLRAAIRPGITGWAQTQLGYVSDVVGWEKKLAYDLYYMKRWSLPLDLRVMLETLRILLLMRGV